MRDAKILEDLGLITEGDPRLDAPLPAALFRAMSLVRRYFDAQMFGAEHIPETGPVLLVGNHALLGIDAWALMPTLINATGRYPRALMLRSLFEAPYLGPILRELGGEPGTREVATQLLANGNIVVVYPGGARDSMKGRDQQYELCWGDRKGFAAVAIEAQCPVIPVAAIGPDEVFPMLSRKGVLKMGWLGKDPIPLFLPLARRLPFQFHLGDPILPPSVDETDPERQAQEFANSVREILTEMLETHRVQEPRPTRGISRLLRRGQR